MEQTKFNNRGVVVPDDVSNTNHNTEKESIKCFDEATNKMLNELNQRIAKITCSKRNYLFSK